MERGQDKRCDRGFRKDDRVHIYHYSCFFRQGKRKKRGREEQKAKKWKGILDLKRYVDSEMDNRND